MIKDVEPLLKECEETLTELKKMGNMEAACYVQGFINSINKLPEADQSLHGYWKKIGTTVMCSVCEHGWGKGHVPKDLKDYNFCPNCGADMRKEWEVKKESEG